MHKYILSIIGILIFAISSYAQMSAEEALSIIEENGLVVRVSSYKTQIDTLESLIHSDKVSSSRKESLSLRLSELKSEYSRKTRMMMAYFDSYFDYCEVHFVPDYMFKEIVNGKRGEIFLNKDLELVGKESNLTQNFVFASFPYNKFRPLKIRHSKYLEEYNAYASILPPFPTISKASDILRIFRSLNKKEDINLTKTIKGLNDKLHQLKRELR